MNLKKRHERAGGLILIFLTFSLFFTACSLVERTPNQAFVNDFLEQANSDPLTAYDDWTSKDLKSAVSSEDFLSLVEEISNFSAYTSYVQTLSVLSFSLEFGTFEIEDYGDFTSSTGELVPVVVYLESTNGDLKLTGIFTVESLIRGELDNQINPETGYVDYSLDGFDYNPDDREITFGVTFVDQNGSEFTRETRYFFNSGDIQGWVVQSE